MKTIRGILQRWHFLVLFFLVWTFGGGALAQTTVSNVVPIVTVQATQPVATTNNSGEFTFFRAGNTNLMLNVWYNLSGMASNGVGYATIPEHLVTIAAGMTSSVITITPLTNEPSGVVSKTVVLQLGISPLLTPVNYEIGSPSNAVVFIKDPVDIISPKEGTTFYAPTNILILAYLNNVNSLTNLEFFAGTNDVGKGILNTGGRGGVSGLIWTNPPVGNYALTAVASYNDLAWTLTKPLVGYYAVTSAPVNITVEAGPPPNLPPMVKIVSPADGAVFWTPTNIFIGAIANDSDGSVASVQFFAGTNSLGFGWPMAVPAIACSNCPPFPNYGQIWTNPPTGSYILTAVATDNDGASTTSAPVNVTIMSGPPPNLPPVVNIIAPTNGTVFPGPTNLVLFAQASDPDGSVTNVEFFAGTNDLGEGYGGVLDPPGINGVVGPVYFVRWSGMAPGQYVLTAVAADNDGVSTTSAPVNITVLPSPPPTNQPPVVRIGPPTNGATFFTPADISIFATASASSGVAAIEFFADGQDLGPGILEDCVTPAGNCVGCPPPVLTCTYSLVWSNAPAGKHALTALATDNGGLTTTSAPVNIVVLPQTNLPPVVRIISPANGAVFHAPINIPLYAFASDPDDPVSLVEFFAGDNSLGFGQRVPVATPLADGAIVIGGPVPPIYPTNLFFLIWSNAPAGDYSLTAVATDNGGLSATSVPVKITVLSPLPPPTNRPAIVSIVATDPVAIEGTNSWVWPGETNSPPTWAAWPTAIRRSFTNCGPKTATFTVRRSGETNDDLTVNYALGGSASNGVDYVALPGFVIIPSGERRAFITVVPIDDGPPDVNKTVVLALTPSTNAPPDYLLGFPRRAAAIILDRNGPRPVTGLLPGGSFHLAMPGPDAAWFCIEYSTNLNDWTPVCTNQVINGSIDFVDPDAQSNPSRFYRVVPLTNPPSE